MNSSRPSNPGRLAWLVFALAVGFCVAGLALTISGPTGGPGIEKIRIEDVIDVVCFLAFPLLGALLVSEPCSCRTAGTRSAESSWQWDSSSS